METAKRLDYLDMAKGIGMLLVLMGHLQGDTIFSLSPYFHPLCVFIFSFHMPLFFIISGTLMRIRDDKLSSVSIKEHINKRFRGIIIPYFWFSFFYFLVVIYAYITGSIAYQTVLINLWYIISGYGMNVLWFLPALFFGEILFLLFKTKFSSKVFYISIPVISSICYYLAYILTTLSYNSPLEMRLHELTIVILRPFLVCGWIFVGYIVYGIWEKSGISNKIKSRYAYIPAGLFMLILCAVFSKVNNGVDFRSLVLRNAFFYILCSLLGSYGLILLCKGLPKIRLFTFWGTGSLIFMAVHNSETILFYALKLSMYINQFLTHARGYICYLIILTIILLYTSLLIYIIGRFFPFILGKPFKKKTSNNE